MATYSYGGLVRATEGYGGRGYGGLRRAGAWCMLRKRELTASSALATAFFELMSTAACSSST